MNSTNASSVSDSVNKSFDYISDLLDLIGGALHWSRMLGELRSSLFNQLGGEKRM